MNLKQLLTKEATPYITGLFLVSLVSGVALFFHFQQGWFHAMHEWLSMVLIVPFVLHMWRNWKPFKNYFKRSGMVIALALSLLVSILFAAWPASEDSRAGGPPQFAFSRMVISQSPEKLSPILGISTETMIKELNENGLPSVKEGVPIIDAIKQDEQRPEKVYALLSSLSTP